MSSTERTQLRPGFTLPGVTEYAPQRHHVLMARTCDYVTLHGHRDFTDVKGSEMGDDPA